MMVFRKSAPALMAFVIVLTVLSFDPAIVETDWFTIKAKVFKACHNMIKQGPGSSDEPTLRCCQSFIREDVDGICEHLNDLDDQTVLKKTSQGYKRLRQELQINHQTLCKYNE